MDKLRILDLFSGIGGFSLGLERTGGFETVAFCEIESFPQKVLKKHWPGVPIYEDVKELTAKQLTSDGIAIDVITAGFPCQDISYAGKGAGLAGERSGLFYEVARLIGELEPRFVILENVSALLTRGLSEVLGTLASIGYDAEWHCIPASELGANHHRDRIWIVAYPKSIGLQVSNKQYGIPQEARRQRAIVSSCDLGKRYFTDEPGMGRVANGIPNRSHRLKCLGNAVVPPIPELIGRAIRGR